MIAKSRALLMLLAIISLAHSQTPNEVRIDPQQPTVYFTPARLAGDKLWLRLHNNSRWAISFHTENPVERLKPIAYFYVCFRYEWGGDRDEPEHRVRFEYYPETKVPGDN